MALKVQQPLSLCAALVAVLLTLLVAGCGVEPHPVSELQVSGGTAAAGKVAIERYGCGSCHNIPGVPNAKGDVGPPLGGVGNRRVIGGYLANTPENLAHWIQSPQSVAPGNAMPDMGVSDQDARDMAAYLATLK